MSADALIRDDEGRVLVVKPNYKPGWDRPGGMVEERRHPGFVTSASEAFRRRHRRIHGG